MAFNCSAAALNSFNTALASGASHLDVNNTSDTCTAESANARAPSANEISIGSNTSQDDDLALEVGSAITDIVFNGNAQGNGFAADLNGGANTIRYREQGGALREFTFEIINVGGDDTQQLLGVTAFNIVEMPPEINVEDANGSTFSDGDLAANIGGDERDFGDVLIAGTATVVRTFTIENTGTDDLTIGTISSNDTNFTVTQAVNNDLAPNGTTTFTVTFDPTASGADTAAITIPNNDADEGPFVFEVSGNGAAPEINVEDANGSVLVDGDAAGDIGGDEREFGNVATPGATTQVRTFTIENTGDFALSINGTITSDDANFTVTQPGDTNLAPNETTTFNVTFNPTTLGADSATITIANTDADENPFTFVVVGNGIAGAPANIAIVGGNGQDASVGNNFGTALVVSVTDADGNAVANGIDVTFTSPATPAAGALFGGNTSITLQTAGGNGQVSSGTFTPNGELGTYTVVASTPGVVATADFNDLENTLGAPTNLTINDGNNQSVANLTAFAPFVVELRDTGGNQIPNASVTFTVVAGGTGATGTFPGGATTSVVTTNANGVATSAVLTADGTIGAFTVTAQDTAGNVTQVVFNASNTSGVVTNLAGTTGGGQNTAILTQFGNALVATATDAGGNPLEGMSVTFTAPENGASATFASNGTNTETVQTAANGQATSSALRASNAVGTFIVTGSFGTLTPATFTLTNDPGDPANVTIVSGDNQNTAINRVFGDPMVVLVADVGGNPLSNIAVTFTAPNSGASATFDNGLSSVAVTTDANGLATSPIAKANDTPGSFQITASVPNIGNALFNMTNDRDSERDIATTQRVIKNFIVKRANEIIADDFDIADRFNRNGVAALSNPAGFAASGEPGQIQASFSTSLSAFRARNRAANAAKQAGNVGSAYSPFEIFDDIQPETTSATPWGGLANATVLGFADADDGATHVGGNGIVLGLDESPSVSVEDRFDFWAKGRLSTTENGTSQSDLLLLYFGSDYKLTDDLLFGVSVQVDVADEIDRTLNIATNGTGWLAGPYFAARVAPNVIIDGRIAAGQSYNEVDPLGLGSSDFTTDRVLGRLGITGTFTADAFTFRPNAQVIYFGEKQKAFTDNLGNAIPSQSVDIGRLVIDPEIRYTFAKEDGTTFSPFFSTKGIWDFASEPTVNVLTGIADETTDDPRLRLEGGLGIKTPHGTTVNLQGFYDGIGQNDFKAYGGNIQVRIPLQKQ